MKTDKMPNSIPLVILRLCKRILPIIIMAIFVKTSIAANAAYGVSWGDSGKSLLERNPSLYEVKRTFNITIYKTASMPKGWSDSEFYDLFVHKSFGLQKIVATSKPLTNDVSGTKGMNEYINLRNILTIKYGSPIFENEKTSLENIPDSKDFYWCIIITKCPTPNAAWDSKPGIVSLRLNGVSRGKGYISIVHEGPNWIKVDEESKNNKNEANKSAFKF